MDLQLFWTGAAAAATCNVCRRSLRFGSIFNQPSISHPFTNPTTSMQSFIHRIILFLIYLNIGRQISSLAFSSLDRSLTKSFRRSSHTLDCFAVTPKVTARTSLNLSEDVNEGEDAFPRYKDVDLPSSQSSSSSMVKEETSNYNGDDTNSMNSIGENKMEKNSDNGKRNVQYLKKKSDEGITGIGGQGGIVYDVNKVKRNLVQETVKAYKGQLFDLLATPPSAAAASSMDPSVDVTDVQEGGGREFATSSTVTDALSLWPGITLEDFIEAKIKALVDVNPVTTTTDSNLLEGLWELAYWVDNATAVLNNTVLSTFSSRNIIRTPITTATKKNVALSSKNTDNKKKPKKQSQQKSMAAKSTTKSRRTGTIFTSSTRQFYLENLDDKEDAYVIDKEISLDDGLFAIQRRYDISKLTRTSLDLTLRTCQAKLLFGALSIPLPTKRSATKREERHDPTNRKTQPYQNVLLHIRILYLDSDLCICLVNDTNKSNNEGSLAVYTKSEQWIGTKERVRRKVRFFLSTPKWTSILRFPFHFRGKILRWIRHVSGRGDTTSASINKEIDKIFFKRDLGTSKVKVLKFGNTANEEEESWEGDEDPFVTLDPITRQEVMKNMKLSEIEQLQRVYKKQAAANRAKEQRRINRRRPKQMKKPPPSAP